MKFGVQVNCYRTTWDAIKTSILAWVFVAAGVVWFILKATMGIRVSEEDEQAGVDISETGIEAYPEFAQAT